MSTPTSSLPELPRRSAGKGRIVAALLTALWLGAAVAFVLLGGAGAAIRPAEILGLVSGVILPVVVLWHIVGWLESGRLLREQTEALHEQLSELIYPTADAEGQVRTIIESLRGQASALTSASADATSRAHAMRTAMREQLEQMEKLAEKINAGFNSTVEALGREVARVDEITSAAIARAREVEGRLAVQVKEAAKASETSLTVVQASFDRVSERARSFEASTVAVCERLESSSALLSQRSNQLIDLGNGTADAAEGIGRVLEGHLGELSDVTARAEAAAAGLDRRGEVLATVADRLGELDHAMEGALERAGTVAGRVDESAKRLQDAGLQADQALEKATGRLESSAATLRASGDEVAKELKATAAGFDEVGQAMREAAGGLGREAEAMRTASAAAAGALREVRDGLAGQLEILGGETAESERLGAAIAERGEALAALLSRSTADFTGAAGRIGTQVEALDGATGRLAERLHAAQDGIGQETRRLDQSAEAAAGRLDAVVEHLAAVWNTLENRRGEIEAAAAKLGDYAHGLEETSAEVVRRVEVAVTGLGGQVSLLGGSLDAADEITDELDSRQKAATEAFAEQRRQLAEIGSRLQAEAGAAAASLGREAETLRQAAVAVAEVVLRAEQAVGARVEALDAAATAIDGEAGSLAARIEPMTGRLVEVAQAMAAAREDLVRAGSDLLPAGDGAAERAGQVARLLGERLEELKEFSHGAGETAHILAEQSGKASAAAEEMAARAAQLTDALEAQRQQLETTRDSVVEAVDRLAPTIERLRSEGGSLRSAVDGSVAQLADTVAGLLDGEERMGVAAERLVARAETVAAVGYDLEQRMAALDGVAENLSLAAGGAGERLAGVTAALTDERARLEAAEQAMAVDLDRMDGVLRRLTHEAGLLHDSIEQVVVGVRQASDVLHGGREQVDVTAERLQQRIDALAGAGAAAVAAAETLSGTLARQAEGMTTAMARAGEVGTMLGQQGALLDRHLEQVEGVLHQAEGLLARAAEAETAMDERSRTLASISEQAAGRVGETLERLSTLGGDLQRAGLSARAAAKTLGDALEEQRKRLEEVSQRSAAGAKEAQKALEPLRELGASTQGLSASLGAVMVQSGTLRESFAQQTAELNDASKRVASRVRLSEEALGKLAAHIDGVVQAAAKQAGDIAAALKQAVAGSGLDDLEGASLTAKRLAEEVQAVAAAATQAQRAIGGASRLFKEQSDGLHKASGEAVSMVASCGTALRGNAEDLRAVLAEVEAATARFTGSAGDIVNAIRSAMAGSEMPETVPVAPEPEEVRPGNVPAGFGLKLLYGQAKPPKDDGGKKK